MDRWGNAKPALQLIFMLVVSRGGFYFLAQLRIRHGGYDVFGCLNYTSLRKKLEWKSLLTIYRFLTRPLSITSICISLLNVGIEVC